MAYLLDTNVFLTAKRLHYGFDFCPAFWDWLIASHADGKVFSVKKVCDELCAKNDELSTWAKQMDSRFFLLPDSAVQPAFKQVSSWAFNQDYRPSAIAEFMKSADYYLVAHALAGKHAVVTHEVKHNGKIKIPIACQDLNIKCLAPHDMLRKEQARFVLEAAA